MRRLVLFRHSKTVASVPAGDHARHLSARGLAEAVSAGALLRDLARPDLALVSDARRTRETFDRIIEAFGREIAHRFDPGLYGASADEILTLAGQTSSETGTLLIVGHNPGLGDLARHLVRTAPEPERRELDARFPTSAFAVISLDAPDWAGAGQGGALQCFIRPHDAS